jgi:hypothetical protein
MIDQPERPEQGMVRVYLKEQKELEHRNSYLIDFYLDLMKT